MRKISFVHADIEIGQPLHGLSNGSKSYLEHAETFDFEIIGTVSEKNTKASIKFFDLDSLEKFSFLNYKYLSDLSYLGLQKNRLNLNVGGDHSVALATVEASLRRCANTLVIWVDAHADLNNVDHSPSGNLHGMPVYYLMQDPTDRPTSLNWMRHKLRPDQVIYFGLRDIDDFERSYLIAQNILYFTVHELRVLGLKNCLNTIEKKIADFESIHFSFDIDALDTSYGLCTGVPVHGGLTEIEVLKLAELVEQSGKLINIDFVEVNPTLAKKEIDLKNNFSLLNQILKTLTFKTDLTKGDQHARTTATIFF